jgi:hypothetical protein
MLSQMLAVRKGLLGRTDAEVTAIYHDLQKTALFSGLSRTYLPVDAEGTKLPPEYTKVQQTVEKRLADIGSVWSKAIDVVYTVDEGNTAARGKVVLDGDILFEGPVPFLLYVEKQLVHLRTILSKVPTLDPAVRWEADQTGDASWRSVPESTTRTQKVLKNHVKAEATEKHPAQVETFQTDVIVGTWELTKFSGAITSKRRNELLQRVNDVIDAIRSAVEQANATAIEQKQIGEALFAYLLS